MNVAIISKIASRKKMIYHNMYVNVKPELSIKNYIIEMENRSED